MSSLPSRRLSAGAAVAGGLLAPQVALAGAVAVLVGLVARGGVGGAVAWLAAAAVGAAVLVLPVAERASEQQPLQAKQLPGYRPAPALPGPGWVRSGVGVFVAALALAAWYGSVRAVVLIALLSVAALAVLLVVGLIRLRRRPRERARLTAALESYEPRYALYTGRRNDAGYQLRMWVALLERLGLPYIVVVRHPAAMPIAAEVTTAPIVCPLGALDLDCVAVRSLGAAFYVNMTADNNSFVLYRGMTHVYLGHGDSDKELSTHPAHAMFDKIFVAGPAAIERYARHGVVIPAEKFVVVGRPQLSAAEPARRPVGEARPPRVLVAPTWRGYNTKTTLSSLPVAPRLVQELIDAGAEVTFRPHPFSWLGPREGSHIAATDAVLEADRRRTGHAHVLAREQRGSDLAKAFNSSDAMVTDVGSVLVDYFVTGKPYAVVLTEQLDAESARDRYPTLQAAYLLSVPQLRGGGRETAAVLQDLLRHDPLAHRRAAVARHVLGDQPGGHQAFLEAARQVIG